MNIDNDVVFYCNGKVASDIKVSYKLNNSEFNPLDEPLSSEFIYVATNNPAITNIFDVSDEESYTIDTSRITSYGDNTNTIDVTLNTKQTNMNIYIVADLDRPTSATASYYRAKNRTDSSFNARLISFNPQDYYLKIDSVVAHDISGSEGTSSGYVAAIENVNDDVTRIRSVSLNLVDKNGNDVTYNNKKVFISYLFEYTNKVGNTIYMYAPFINATTNYTWAFGWGTSNYGIAYNKPVTIYGNNVPVDSSGNIACPAMPFTYTGTRVSYGLLEMENGYDYFLYSRQIQTRHELTLYSMFTVEAIKHVVASIGLFFYAGGILNMPIVTGNTTDGSFVSGSAIETTDSDIKKYTDTKGHTPVFPDHADDDIIDDMKLGLGHTYLGMVKYYKLNPAQLVVFGQDISDESLIEAGFDAFKSIVSLKLYTLPLSTYGEFTDYEQVYLSYQPLSVMAERLIRTKSHIFLGDYTIEGYHGSISNPHFLDMEPYTNVEVYIPFCGFVNLPTTKVMYQRIEVYLVYDIVLATCVGVVKCNGNIIAEKSGVIGADVPFASQNAGIMNGAIMESALSTAGSAALTAASGITGNAFGAMSGIIAGIASITHGVTSVYKNYTQVVGNAGGEVPFGLPDTCFIKITYPKKFLPENYGRMVGKMCNKTGKLGDFHGFTICENCHVNIKATDEEKTMIDNLLRKGVILP